jgi:DNA-binding NarL/FixJ family response regulator
MAQEKIHLLLVDDHPSILRDHVNSLSKYKHINIETSTNCDDAFKKIKLQSFDILFTDLSFGNNTLQSIKSGEELINQVRLLNSHIKIGVITTHEEVNRIDSVIQNQKPNAYILKSEIFSDELYVAITTMRNNRNYYSQSVHKALNKKMTLKFKFDKIAISILNEYALADKIDNLVGKIFKSDGTIFHKRSIEGKLNQMRTDLNVSNNTQLIIKAIQLGIIDAPEL